MQSESAKFNSEEQTAAPKEGSYYLFDRASSAKKGDELKGFPQIIVKEDANFGTQVFAPKLDAAATQSTEFDRTRPQAALHAVETLIQAFALDRQLRASRQQKFQIETNLIVFESSEERARALEVLNRAASEALASLQRSGQPKYAQTVRALRDYARAEHEFVQKAGETPVVVHFAHHAVLRLESMMPNVDNLYKAVSGHDHELAKIDVNDAFDAFARLKDINDHLCARLDFIDASNQRRNSKLVQENTVLADLNTQIQSLPADGAIFFFNSKSEVVKGPMTFEGKLIGADGNKYRMDSLRADGTVSGADGAPVKIRKTFKAVDIQRWQRHGIDMNGAGIDRLKNDDVVGAVIVRPKQDGKGKPIEIRRQGKGDGGKPSIAKEVVMLFGVVPAEVKPGMSLGNLMKRFDPDR